MAACILLSLTSNVMSKVLKSSAMLARWSSSKVAMLASVTLSIGAVSLFLWLSTFLLAVQGFNFQQLNF